MHACANYAGFRWEGHIYKKERVFSKYSLCTQNKGKAITLI